MTVSPSRGPALLGASTALVLLVTGCFTDGGQDTEGRLGVALAFPPVKQMSPFSDDALLLGRVGAAEPLTRLDEEGELQPLLAQDWDQDEDGAWTLQLREDVTFHDGNPMEAEHVVEALEHASAASPRPRALVGTDLDASAEDEHTVRVETGDGDPILPQRLSAPELAILAPSAYEGDPAAPDPVGAGTGPFELTEVGGGSATLEAHTDYWNGAPSAQGVDVDFVENDASRVGGLRTGEVDVVDAVPIVEAEAMDEDELVEVPIPRTVGVLLNNESGAFTDPGMRAAAAGSVDSAPVAEGVYEGRADAVEGLYGPVSDWAEERARPEGADPEDPDGETITLATYDDRPELPEAASAVAEDLRSAGFEVEVTVQDFATMETDLMEGAHDAVIGTRSYLVETNDPVNYLASDWSCEGSYNLARFCEEDVDTMIAEAAGHTEPEERHEAAVEIEQAVLATDSFVPLVAERARVGVSEGVEGVAQDPLERTLITERTRVP
ncbi:ABC transporter substrate-binding protein [Nocardiopsis salina]|uniref:ABC transporter substrate-binding protein n=1 Tax=Nocardiopsis salina TaxID=245836 RepID=UPI000364A012|nr:ABC transporter substrate-binding protein [Nocardiopsis salina]